MKIKIEKKEENKLLQIIPTKKYYPNAYWGLMSEGTLIAPITNISKIVKGAIKLGWTVEYVQT